MAPRKPKGGKPDGKAAARTTSGRTSGGPARAARTRRPVSEDTLLADIPPGMDEVRPRDAEPVSEQEGRLVRDMAGDDDERLGQLTEYFLRFGAEADPSKPGYDGANAQPAINAISQLSPGERAQLLDRLVEAQGISADDLSYLSTSDKLEMVPPVLQEAFATKDLTAADLSPSLGGLAEDGAKMGAPATAPRRPRAPKKPGPEAMPRDQVYDTLEAMTTHGGWEAGRRAAPEERGAPARVERWVEKSNDPNLTDRQRASLATEREGLIGKISGQQVRQMAAWQDENLFGWDHKTGRSQDRPVYGEKDGQPVVVGTEHAADRVAAVLLGQFERTLDPQVPDRATAIENAKFQYGNMASLVKQAPNPAAAKKAMNAMLNQITIDTRSQLDQPNYDQKMTGETQTRREAIDRSAMESTRDRVLNTLARKAGLFGEASGGHRMDLLPDRRSASVEEIADNPAAAMESRPTGTFDASDFDTSGLGDAAAQEAMFAAGDTGTRSDSGVGGGGALSQLMDDEAVAFGGDSGRMPSGTTVDLDRIAPWWRAQFPQLDEAGAVSYADNSPSGRLLAGLISRSYGAETPQFAEDIAPLIERSILKYQSRKPSTLAAQNWAQRQLQPGSQTSKNFLAYMQNNAEGGAPYPLFMEQPADRSWMADLLSEQAARPERRPRGDGPAVDDISAEDFAALEAAMADEPDIGDVAAGEAGALPADEYYYPDNNRDMPMDEGIDLGPSDGGAADGAVYEDQDMNQYYEGLGQDDGIDLGPSDNELSGLTMPMNRMARFGRNPALAGLIA